MCYVLFRILGLIDRYDFIAFLIYQTRCPHLDDDFACFCGILRVENLVQLLQRPIFGLYEEEVDDAVSMLA